MLSVVAWVMATFPFEKRCQDEGGAASTVACAEQHRTMDSHTGIPDHIRQRKIQTPTRFPQPPHVPQLLPRVQRLGYPTRGLEGGSLSCAVRRSPSLPEISIQRRPDDTRERRRRRRYTYIYRRFAPSPAGDTISILITSRAAQFRLVELPTPSPKDRSPVPGGADDLLLNHAVELRKGGRPLRGTSPPPCNERISLIQVAYSG